MDSPVTEGGDTPSIVQSDTEAAQITPVTPSIFHLSMTDDTLIESGASVSVGTVAASLTGMSPPPDLAEEAMDAVTTWKVAVNVMKQVMDTVSPVVKEVCPIPFSLLFTELIATRQRARSVWTQLSNIPEVRVLALLDEMEHSPFFFLGSLADFGTPVTA